MKSPEGRAGQPGGGVGSRGWGGDWDNRQRKGGRVVDAWGDESWGHSGVVAFRYAGMLGCMSHGVLAGLLGGAWTSTSASLSSVCDTGQ